MISLLVAVALLSPATLVNAVAGQMTGRPGTQVSIDMSVCEPDVYGCADIAGNVIHVEPSVMFVLNRLAAKAKVRPSVGALALLVFCHEARHVRGTRSESVAERWAVANAPVAARLMGASKSWIERMRPWVWWMHLFTTGQPLPQRVPSDRP